VTVTAPSSAAAGKAFAVRVTLSAAGNATLHGVRLALQLPQGWKAAPAGPAVFGAVAPGQGPSATFMVTPPAYAPNATSVVHATATADDWLREAGVNVTVAG
jgi:uncharacterized membrane protein